MFPKVSLCSTLARVAMQRKPGIWAKKKNSGYKTLSQMWTDPNYQNKWQADEDLSTQFFNLASQAMAELSSGIVYVMLPSAT